MIRSSCLPTGLSSFITHFSNLTDPRTTYRGNLRHSLTDIIFLVISAVVSGADSWQSIELFGNNQQDWLRTYIALPFGIPSHDTLGRFFSALDHQAFSECFINWVQDLSVLTQGEVIAIDGKRLRGSYDRYSDKKAIHMVSAFATDNGLCLGQCVCEDKSNEITAIPELLEIIALKGSTVTIDAIGCQTDIAEKIISKEADYILAVKNNQKDLYEQIRKLFKITKPSSTDTTHNTGHGRVETRSCSVIEDLTFLDSDKQWKGLKTIIKIDSERFTKIDKKSQKETRYYISSLPPEAAAMNKKIRNHWAIENKLHWMLDVNFNEDASRKRMGYSASNYNIITKVALSLITKTEAKKGVSQKNKRYLAALSSQFREKVLKI